MKNRSDEIKRIHTAMKRTAYARKFANELGIKVERAEIGIQQALKETRDALKNHPAILAHEARN